MPDYNDTVAASADLPPSPAAGISDDAPLPNKVAYLPVQKPGGPSAAVQAETAFETTLVAPEAVHAAAPVAAAAPEPTSGQMLENGGPILTAGTMPAPPARKKSIFAGLFGSTPAEAEPAPENQAKPKPRIEPVTVKPAEKPEMKPLRMASLGGSIEGLPGVRTDSLFEITRKSGIDDDSDVDLHENEQGAPLILASAAGMARLAPNGLLKQREEVDVGCLKPNLVRMLRTVESHYRKKMVVTSGYRSPTYNRQVKGARNSQHMYCAAVDVQIPGVSKWELARYVRSLPGRGGVGTYCHTESVHIDIGPERDWNWRCRRRG